MAKAPRPLPHWFWKLAAWNLGRGEYRGHKRDPAMRASTGAPARVPAWFRDELHRRFPEPKRPPPPPPPPDPPPPPPKPPRSKTKGRGILYYYNSVNALHHVVEEAAVHRLSVALLCHEGENVVTEKHNPDGLADRLRAAGVPISATGFVMPTGDYAKVAETIARVSDGFDEYMANVENAWGYPAPGFSESEKLVEAIRKVTDIPLAVAIENREPLHFRPWLDAEPDLVVRPECYMNEIGLWASPAAALHASGQAQADLTGGLRPDQVEPLLGKYGQFNQSLSDWHDPVQDGLLLGVRCYGVWAAEFCTVDDVATVAAARR